MPEPFLRLPIEAVRHPGRLHTIGAMFTVGVAVTAALFVLLGHFTQPDVVANEVKVGGVSDPFVGEVEPSAGNPQTGELVACEVMQIAIEDINARMSEGVNEAQARYFRSRRNQLYLIMRDRCGV